MLPIVSIEKKALFECANHSFEEFRSLEDKTKGQIIENGLLLIDVLESTYRACHYFPDEMKIRLSGYTTYIRSTDVEKFLENCPDDIYKSKLIQGFKQTLSQLSKIVRQQFAIVQPTDTEFIALFGLGLWKEENVKHDENLVKIASQVRSNILRDLRFYYAKKGTSNYAYRLGSLFCLLMNCQDCSTLFNEDFRLFRLFNLFDSSFKDPKQ